MASNRSCVNSGGLQSLVRLDGVPQLEAEIRLTEEARQALTCWQARPGQILTATDPEGTCYRVRIVSLVPEQACCIPFAVLRQPAESDLHLAVYQALPERERFELVLQKLTELGVDRIVPIETRRSATRAERDAGQKKSHRWPEVVRKAALQCRRGMIPELFPVQSLAEALAGASSAELKLVCYEGEAPWSLSEGCGSLRPQSVALLIGPEGGFEDDEIALAREQGFLPVSLGPRILRTETAAIVAAALVQSTLGDLK